MKPSNNKEHDAVIELLSWYAKGLLNPAEQERVSQHLSTCTDCQQELVLYRQLASATLNSSKPAWKPSAAQFSTIMQNIDALEANTAAAAPTKTTKATKTPGLFAKFSTWLKTIPRPVFWIMSMETLAIAALVMLVVARLPAQLSGGQLFETLSNEHQPVSAMLPRLHIVFNENITEHEIRMLLQAQQLQLVEGPSMLGVYTLQLATGGTQEQQQAITNLRTHAKVKLVEGITKK
ncbi:anti-sigma factor family protein [Crenothrix sp.]|uniref:anti-sigma factor family protein n=1 Tax=Crenothrix sp. TaxID=3100433 RepID=UPI00374D5ACF